MDCSRVGSLIYRLRKERNMTQKQLADIMNISDKTISKWERGLGCPDITLLRDLSKVLDVNIENILLGDLEENINGGENMKKIKFYVCQKCGNIITAMSEGDMSCCGRKLNPLIAKKADENHCINIETVENDFYITFKHDMTKEHYISFVAYVAYDRVLLVKLYPEQNSEVRFPKMYGSKIYFYCTKDGLFANS